MSKSTRNAAIYARHKSGMSQTKIGKLYGLSQSAVSKIIIFLKSGKQKSEIETRGRKSYLTEVQKKRLKQLLKQNPQDHGYFVWNKWSIQAIIASEFGVHYHENYIYKIMKCINFSSQKPALVDYRKDEQKVATFKEEQAETIKKKAALENRRLVFQDECAVRLLPSVAKTYAPVGQTPILSCNTKNKGFVSVSGGISSDGYAYFEVREQEGFKQMGLVRFLDNMIADSLDNMIADSLDRISLIWDNAPSHHAKTVSQYFEGQNRIETHNLPPYSPELNPIEQVWAYAKGKLANQFFKTTQELRKAVTNVLNEMKKDKQLIQSFFKNEELDCYHFFS